MEPQSWESVVIKQFCSVFYEKKKTLNFFNREVEIGEKYNRNRKKLLKLKGLIFYLTEIKLQIIVKAFLDDIKFHSPDMFQTPLYTPLGGWVEQNMGSSPSTLH